MSDIERVIEIEIQMAEHRKVLDELSDMIFQQWREIEQLKQHIHFLMVQLEDKNHVSPPIDRPPHY